MEQLLAWGRATWGMKAGGDRQVRLRFLADSCIQQQTGGRIKGWGGRLTSASLNPWGSDLGSPSGLGVGAGCSLLCPSPAV